MSTHNIFHMASFSRSGETLLQRCLNAHPDIEVVHQINEPDTPEDLELFKHLIKRKEQTIQMGDPLLWHRRLNERSVILLKNAVWVHGYPRRGFILVRNPFALATSAHRADPDPDQAQRQKKQQRRWARGIDPLMQFSMGSNRTLTGFLTLYNRKMLQDRREGLPFVRYEDFVADPETWLRRIVAQLGLEWDDAVLHSHQNYPEGKLGHGGIKLWKPINPGSLDKYKTLPREIQSQIYSLCHETLLQYGYTWDGETLGVREVEGIL